MADYKADIKDIVKLREKTSAGIVDCRMALEETKGDMKAAEEWLRKHGMEKADKKAAREVKVGMIFSYVHHTGRLGTLVALACETDFVAKTDAFQKLGKELAMQIAGSKPDSVEELLKQEYMRDASKTIQDLMKETIGKLGENIQITDFKILTV